MRATTLLIASVTALAVAAAGCGSDHQKRLRQIDDPTDGDVDLDPDEFQQCMTSANCEDGDLCTVNRCVDERCVLATLPTEECCASEEVYAEGFDGDLDGVTFASLNNDAGWSVVDGRAASPPRALYFGDPASQSYNVGVHVAGAVTTPPVDLPIDRQAILTMRMFAGIETSLEYDQLWVEADIIELGAVADTVTVLTKEDLPADVYQDFALVDVDLSDLHGRRVVLRLRFDSVDARGNDYEGVYIDDLKILASCPLALPCTDDASCDDDDACTADICTEEGCVSATICPITGPDPVDDNPCLAIDAPADCCVEDADCDDGNPATVDVCDGATCAHTLNPDACTVAADCDDGESCTTDSCNAGLCEHTGGAEPGCCVDGVEGIADFDNERLQGIYVTDNFETGVFWRTDKTRATTPEFSLYCGEPVAQTYAYDRRVKSSATTRPLAIPKGGDTTLVFDLYKDTRVAKHYDVFQVFVLRDGALLAAWSSKLLDDGTTGGAWTNVRVPLTQYAGKDIQVRFVFDSVDAPTAGFEGVYIDSLELETVCR